MKDAILYFNVKEEQCFIGNVMCSSRATDRDGRTPLPTYPSPRLSDRPRAFLSQPRFEYAEIRRPLREEGAMRVFRANDKMSAKEPGSVTRGQGWDPIPSILPQTIPPTRRVSS